MKQRRASYPRMVKNGSAVVRIYKTTSRGYPLFQVSDFSQGSRRLRSFADEKEALAEAERIARLIANGETTAAAMRNTDAASYGRSLEILRPTGDSIELAASRYAEAVKLLGAGDRLIEAVKYFLANDPGNLPDRDVASVVNEFIEHRKARGKSERYVKDLESRLGRFRKTFQVKLASVRGSEVQAFLDDLKGSQQTIKNYRTVLGTLFSFAKARGYIRQNPIDDTERVSPSAEGAVEIYTPKEIGELLKAATASFLPSLALGAFAGLRSQEIERLAWQDVDFASGYITVGGAKAKTRSRRLIPICDTLRAWIQPHAKKHGLIWTGTHDGFYDAQGETVKLSKVAWKHNGLRHSYASYRLAMIQNAAHVALELGNSPGVVFKHYRELVSLEEGKKWFAVIPGAIDKDNSKTEGGAA